MTGIPDGSFGTQFSGYPLVGALQPDDLILLQRQSLPGPIGTVAITAANAIPSATTQIYDIGMGFQGVPPVSSTILVFKAARAFLLPIGLVGSVFSAQVLPSAATVLNIQQNGSVIGTLTWTTASLVPTVAFAAAITLAIGDELRIVTPATLNGLATLALTFKATPQ